MTLDAMLGLCVEFRSFYLDMVKLIQLVHQGYYQDQDTKSPVFSLLLGLDPGSRPNNPVTW